MSGTEARELPACRISFYWNTRQKAWDVTIARPAAHAWSVNKRANNTVAMTAETAKALLDAVVDTLESLLPFE